MTLVGDKSRLCSKSLPLGHPRIFWVARRNSELDDRALHPKSQFLKSCTTSQHFIFTDETSYFVRVTCSRAMTATSDYIIDFVVNDTSHFRRVTCSRAMTETPQNGYPAVGHATDQEGGIRRAATRLQIKFSRRAHTV